MNVLVLNCGSSSVKFQLIDTDKRKIDGDADKRLARGVIERVGTLSLITLQADGKEPVREEEPLRDYRAAIDRITRWLIAPESGIKGIRSMADIQAVGHRVVHGGEKFKTSTKIDADVLAGIEDCIELAPLHNPANLKGIRAAAQILGPGVPQVAVFDTAFHSTMPETAYLYGIPYQLYRRHKIRRYGFHGTSHRYVSYRYRKLVGVARDSVNIITVHLGNGCSACAIKGGESVNTSMGFTPLEGMIMGTRSGDIDPSIVEYLSLKEGMSLVEIDGLLNRQSGLLGISGLTGDMRDLLAEEAENQDRRARLAIELFCAKVRRTIGGYFAEMGGADALVFTGGIGENSAEIRRRICTGLECIGLTLDPARNKSPETPAEISRRGSKLKAWVIPTNEELLIARDTFRVVAGVPLPV